LLNRTGGFKPCPIEQNTCQRIRLLAKVLPKTSHPALSPIWREGKRLTRSLFLDNFIGINFLPDSISVEQRHRGQHPEDAKLFAEKWIPILRQAVQDLSWLLSRGYPDAASLQLIGNRFRLTERQMNAVMRSSCAEEARQHRMTRMQAATAMAGKAVAIDGYNLLITLESALSGGLVFRGHDTCYRDLASVHRTYKRVEETLPALTLIGETLNELGIKEANWYFDSPVSNSGRLKTMLYELATEKGWNWTAELVFNPDTVLVTLPQTVITADSWILDNATHWFNLLDYLIKNKLQDVNLQDLG